MLRPKISFVVVTYNSARFIEGLIKSIIKNVKLSYELIIVDNDSKDDTRAITEKILRNNVETNELSVFSRCQLDSRGYDHNKFCFVKNHSNEGFAQGNNLGIEISKGEAVFLLNPDTIMCLGTDKVLFDFLFSDKRVGLVAPRLIYFNGRFQESCRKFFKPEYLLYEFLTLFNRAPWSKRFCSWKSVEYDLKRPFQVEQPMAAAWLVKKEVFEEIGLFDERFYLFFNDVDFCYRLHFKYATYYHPKGVIKHYKGHSVYSNRISSLIRSHINMVAYIKKHYFKPSTFWFWWLVVYGGLLLRVMLVAIEKTTRFLIKK